MAKNDKRPAQAPHEQLRAEQFVQQATRSAQAQPASREEMEPAPAGSTTGGYDLTALADAELQALLNACSAEAKVRKESARALLPPIGANVRVTSGRWEGKTGKLISRGKTRGHVAIEGMPVPAYVALDEVEVVAEP